ncbi:hypothetical protein H0E87_004637 [Populus deltoides]|uniref:Uncharacterized protein n=1 Tax=Populus deltoides TaxID=3696 RepID=A0A8T2ZHP9_POPDE|nr:hypothetical protein H0E87_004637 [Populus deltoides]
MNVSASEYSGGGCESGWTSYLNQSSNSKHQYQGFGGFVDGDYARVEEDQEEDLSMVSDASSGPPQYCEDDEYGCDKLAKKSNSKKKSKEYGRSKQHSYLDDTASSPALGKKVNNEGTTEHVLEFSQGFSATHFKVFAGVGHFFPDFFRISSYRSLHLLINLNVTRSESA